jgi:hypothetical protein
MSAYPDIRTLIADKLGMVVDRATDEAHLSNDLNAACALEGRRIVAEKRVRVQRVGSKTST